MVKAVIAGNSRECVTFLLMVIAMVVNHYFDHMAILPKIAGSHYILGIVSQMIATLGFASAYRQLAPTEKVYVDGYVAYVEYEAARNNERISNALHRAIPIATVEASRGLLDRPLVRAAIAERINELAAASELTVHRVVKELMGIAFSSVGDYMQIGEDGQPYFDLARCTPEQLAAIASVEIEETGTPFARGHKRKFKFKLHDKLGGIDKLARYMGMLDPDNPFWRAEQSRPVGGGQQAALPAGATIDKAADMYAQLING